MFYENKVICVLGNYSELAEEIKNANPKNLILVSANSYDLPKIKGEILLIETDPLLFSLQFPVDYLIINYFPKCGNKLSQLLWYNFINVKEKIVIKGTSYFWNTGFDPDNSGDRPGLSEAVDDLSSFGFEVIEETDSVTINMKKEMAKAVIKKKGCGCGGNPKLRERVKNALRR